MHAQTSLDFAAASTLAVAGHTAWFAVVELGHVRAGEAVVTQPTGGVSLFAVQSACVHGARVIVVSSSSEKLDRLQKLHPIQGIGRSRNLSGMPRRSTGPAATAWTIVSKWQAMISPACRMLTHR